MTHLFHPPKPWQKTIRYPSDTAYLLYWRNAPDDVDVFRLDEGEPYLSPFADVHALARKLADCWQRSIFIMPVWLDGFAGGELEITPMRYPRG